MTSSRRALLLQATAIISTAPFACSGAYAQTMRSAVAANPAHLMNYVPHIIAATQNFMASERIDFKLISAGGKLQQIIAAGQAQFGIGDSSHVIQLLNQGKPARILMGVDTRSLITNVLVRKDLFDSGITSIEKVAAYRRPDGAKPIIAVSTLGGGQHVYASYIFEKLGVYNQMNWIAGGVTATMLGGLRTGKFDAMVAAPSWQFDAVENNFGRVIFDATIDSVWNQYFSGPIPATCIYALKETIDSHPELVQGYVNGMYRSMQWLKGATPEQIWDATGAKYFGDQGRDLALKEARFFKPLFNYDGTITESQFANGAQVWFRESTQMKRVGFDEAVNQSFLNNARKRYA